MKKETILKGALASSLAVAGGTLIYGSVDKHYDGIVEFWEKALRKLGDLLGKKE